MGPLVDGWLGFGVIAIDLLRMALATLPAVGGALWVMGFGDWPAGPTLHNGGVLALAGGAGGALYLGAAALLGIEEVKGIGRRFRR